MFIMRILIAGILCSSLSIFCMEKPLCVLKEVNGKEVDGESTKSIVDNERIYLTCFAHLKEAHIHNSATQMIVMPKLKDFLLINLRSFSLTNSNITTFPLETFLEHTPNLESLDLCNNRELSKLIIFKYQHGKLGYIGLNNTRLSKEQISDFKSLIRETKFKKPLICAETYSFNMPQVTHSSPELHGTLSYYNE